MNASLILASGSKARQTLLAQAGLSFAAIPAAIDEETILRDLEQKISAPDIAAELARRKALAVAADHPGALVIGADQILFCAGKIYTKAKDQDEARANLKSLSGRTHQLISAVCVAEGQDVLWEHADSASLTMRAFDDAFLERYLAEAGDAVLKTVGGYEIEGAGVRLFEKTDGDFFTILGLPLLPLLDFLFRQGLTR